ncbi:MAG: serine/threonine-protein kinase [Gemmatimonadaceae bacterium]
MHTNSPAHGTSGPADLLGTIVAGRYHVDATLGTGAAASVFLARDTRYDREVAIKVLRPEVAAAVGVNRFEREIAVSARLSHPHIVPMLDTGETRGMMYYVMPALTEGSLRARLTNVQRLPVDEAIHIARDVALALDHAHERGIVHRDIKPENVLLSGGAAVVTDFGIAKILGESSRGNSLTRQGVAIGTVLYMSPEQASAGPVDGRTDVYALGCLVYEMLTGRPPYMGPNLQAIVAMHFADAIPSVCDVRASVPQAVDVAIATAMAKNPDARYARASDFAAALAQARTTSPDAAASVAAAADLTATSTRAMPAESPARSGRVATIATLLGVAMLVIVFLLSLHLATPGRPADSARPLTSIAVLPFGNVSLAGDQEYLVL